MGQDKLSSSKQAKPCRSLFINHANTPLPKATFTLSQVRQDKLVFLNSADSVGSLPAML
jgi:hypothetical protein